MIKAVTSYKRRPELTVAEFRRRWEAHAELVVQLPGLRRYVQNPTDDTAYAQGSEPIFDGVAETWFDDADAFRALVAGPEYRRARAAEAEFADPERVSLLVCDEVVVKDDPGGAPGDEGLKFITYISRRPDFDVDAFRRYWREVHGPLVARNPFIRRYVQCHVRLDLGPDGSPPRFDGVPMTWFDSWEEMRASATTPELVATRADEANFLAPGALPFVISTERVVAA